MTENLLGAGNIMGISWYFMEDCQLPKDGAKALNWFSANQSWTAGNSSSTRISKLTFKNWVAATGQMSWQINRTRRHFDQGVCWHPYSLFGKTWPTLKQPGKPFDTARVRLSLPWGWDLGCAIAGNIINNRIPIPLKEYINISHMMKPKKQDPVLNIRGMAL